MGLPPVGSSPFMAFMQMPGDFRLKADQAFARLSCRVVARPFTSPLILVYRS